MGGKVLPIVEGVECAGEVQLAGRVPSPACNQLIDGWSETTATAKRSIRFASPSNRSQRSVRR